MDIKLHKRFEDLINERVQSGQYDSPSDFVEAAIQTHLDQELPDDDLLALIPDLQKKIAEAQASGPPVPADEVFHRAYERQRAIEDKAGR